jgi:N-methylhydantoinase A/oxoprolinase/acetone carboxylase beta subunit
MAILLGVDTGGTYTDAVVLDADQTRVLGWAKRLTTRPDPAPGIAAAIDAALAAAGFAPGDVALVSLSTTLATNALVEGTGGRAALIAIGFDAGDLARAGLAEAMRGDPVIALPGGHDANGAEVAPLDTAALKAALDGLPPDIEGIAIAARFATRNPAHETAARSIVRARTGLPVTCSHALAARLNGPKRALTAVLNARLTGLITRLIAALQSHMAARGIAAPLMVVRGDGALMAAAQAVERPIETILSGPAASLVGALWLTDRADAIVADIGGTTTDVALLRGGRPAIDPDGARVGPWRTMVEAVAMRTTGLGGDSEVHVAPGLTGGLHLGPRRCVPVALMAADHPALVHDALDRALAAPAPGEHDGRFALALREAPGLPARDAAVLARIGRAAPVAAVLRTRADMAALDRLVARGLVLIAAVTPSDAAHVAGHLDTWDSAAAAKALTLMARRRTGSGERLAPDAAALAEAIIAQLRRQTEQAILEAAFAEDGWADDPATLADHPLMRAVLDGRTGLVRLTGGLAVPVIGLGAAAPSYYRTLGARLGTAVVLPDHAGVANAIGAVVGRIEMRRAVTVTSPAEGRYLVHAPDGVIVRTDRTDAIATATAIAAGAAMAAAQDAGTRETHVTHSLDIRETEIEGRPFFVEAVVTATATGRPRLARPEPDGPAKA